MTTKTGPFIRRRPLLLGLSLLLLVAGVSLSLMTLTELESYREFTAWPTVAGTVEISEVIGERAFHPRIVYSYAVAGTRYTDTSFLDMPSFGGRRSRRDAAEKKAAEYPVAAEVTVHYNPAAPADSRLKINAPWSVYGKLGFAGFLVVLGLVAAGLGFRRPSVARSY